MLFVLLLVNRCKLSYFLSVLDALSVQTLYIFDMAAVASGSFCKLEFILKANLSCLRADHVFLVHISALITTQIMWHVRRCRLPFFCVLIGRDAVLQGTEHCPTACQIELLAHRCPPHEIFRICPTTAGRV